MKDDLESKVGYCILNLAASNMMSSNVGFSVVAAWGPGISIGGDISQDGINYHVGFVFGVGFSGMITTGRTIGAQTQGIYSETSIRWAMGVIPVGGGVSLQFSPSSGLAFMPYISSHTEGLVVETSINYGWHKKW